MEDQRFQGIEILSAESAGRIVHLLAENGSLAIELERLEGLVSVHWGLAPTRLHGALSSRLKESAPPVLFMRRKAL